ncbi:hypothetical protein HDU92_005821 [Lobulomyces angularis]|nr:hypothetical protein HDU92_005821 [Lobulomyces angularis]
MVFLSPRSASLYQLPDLVRNKDLFAYTNKEATEIVLCPVCNNRSSSKKSETLVPRRAKSAHVRNVQFRRIGSNDTLKVQRDEKICHMVNPRSTSILYSHAVPKKLSFYKNTNNRLLRLKNLSPRSTSLTLAIPKSPILISDKSNCSQNSRNLSNRNVSLNCHLRQRPSILRTSTRNNYFRSFSPIRTTSLGCNFKQEKSFYNFTSEARSYPNSNPICQILPERTTSLQCIYDNLCDEFVNAKGSVKNKDDDILSIERVRGSSSNSGK